jgi:hypothetical protein
MQWILIGYMFLYIHRPFEVWPVLGEMRLEYFYALSATICVAVYPGKRFLPNIQQLTFFLGRILAGNGRDLLQDGRFLSALHVGDS